MNIDEIKRSLLERLPNFADAINNANFIENKEKTQTVGTDGKDIFYDSDYFEGRDFEQILFAFANAVCHIAFNHVEQIEGKDQFLWNVATDAVINKLLSKSGFTAVDHAINMPEGETQTADEIYANLSSMNQVDRNKAINSATGFDPEAHIRI